MILIYNSSVRLFQINVVTERIQYVNFKVLKIINEPATLARLRLTEELF